MSSAWQRLDDLWYRRHEVSGMKWPEDNERLWTHVVCGARCGGPIALVRDENVFQQLPTSSPLIPKLQTTTALGTPLASIDWTFKGLLGLYWTPEELLVAVFQTGQVRLFDAFATQKSQWTLDLGAGTAGGNAEIRLSLVTFWPGGIVAWGSTTKRAYVNLGFERRSPWKLADAVDSYPSLLQQSDFAAVTISVLPEAATASSAAANTTGAANESGHLSAGGHQNNKDNSLSISMEVEQEDGSNMRNNMLQLPGGNANNPSSVFALLNGGKSDIRVLVSTERHGVFVCAPNKCFQLNDEFLSNPAGSLSNPPQPNQQVITNQDPVTHFAVSPSGFFLALLSEKGNFKVFDNQLVLLDVAHLESRKKPRQMVWVGEDCVALYMASSTKQHALFVGGPRNDWIPYQYDHPLFLVSETDGARIIGQKCEILQRIPPAVESIYSIGSCEPPAMLCYALERFIEGDVRAEESLRAINDDLGDAINQTMDAAMCEFEEKNISSLLQASVFGRTFLSSAKKGGAATAEQASKRFVEACKWIRIATALRNSYDIPVTCAQLQQVGLTTMILRLAARREHLIAKRIADWVGLPLTEKILVMWARDKIHHSPSMTDAELCDVIRKKFSRHGTGAMPAPQQRGPAVGGPNVVRYKYFGRPQNQRLEELPVLETTSGDVPYAEVAEYAAAAHRPALATMLLKNEPQAAQQVGMLLKLGEPLLAFEQAAQPKGDPELLRECLNASDLSGELLTSNLRSRCLHVHTLQKLHRWPALLAFCEGGYPHKRLMAEAQTQLAYASTTSGKHQPTLLSDRIEFLNKATKSFAEKSNVPLKNKEKELLPPDPFSAAVTQEQVSLLKLQEQLETKAQNWPGVSTSLSPPCASVSSAFAATASTSGSSSSSSASRGQQHSSRHNFIGRSLMQTVRVLILMGQTAEAEKIRKDFAIPEKRYWYFKIAALAEARNVEELVTMAKSRSSQSYVPLVEALITLNRPDLGKEFVSQVKDDQRAAQLLMKMGFRKEAEELLQKSNAGGILNWFKGRGGGGDL
ncbi:unnamed protein product [Amoebophrya sp. A120]|nr:unnamed protein product [Amoebophrya sp. A120]|eukprot:GSA120T00018963001.1